MCALLQKVVDILASMRYNAFTVNNKERKMALTINDILGDIDDTKSVLYDMVEEGTLDENVNDQVQELLREVYNLLEEEASE